MEEQNDKNKISAGAATVNPKRGTARLSYLRMTPRKARAIAGLLKGLSINEAEAQLIAQSRRAAKPILKLLRSAVAGAVKNHNSNPGKLYIESIKVDQGPMLKRMLPRARGMATPIQKKMSHVILVLSENQELKSPRFKIEVKKKVRKAAPEKPKKEKKPQQEKTQAEQAARQNQPGFFRKIFRRKSV
ncbi:MAG: 50S ribosomal protein L22 [Candidatus Liptonbacteria bacterium]|nr:50S ribosomal protein L22 [Candidatus Liptonbacteria bacterium]